MNRKQMIETIAKQSGCSKRQVRKKLFARIGELKRLNHHILFEEAILNKDADWLEFDIYKDYRRKYMFEVVFFPSGCIVLFKNIDMKDSEITVQRDVGIRLYNFKTFPPQH